MPPAAAAAQPEPEEKTPLWFWDLVKSIPTDKWMRVFSLVGMRMEPRVPGMPGAKGYLFEIFEPINMEFFKAKYGGGKFRCILCENGKYKTTHEFDIEGKPIYDLTRENPNGISPQTSSGDKSTELLQQFVGVLRDELKNAREANSGNPAGNDRIIEMLTNASDKAIEIVTKQAPAHQDQTAQLATLVGIVKQMMPAPQESGLLALLTPLLKPLLEKLMAPVDPLAQITTFLAIFEKIDTLRGTAGGGDSKPKDWKAMLAEGAVQRGPEILKELRETLQVGRDAATERRIAAEANARSMEIARQMPQPGQPAIAPTNGAQPAASVMPAAGPLRVVPISDAMPADMPAPKPVTPATPAPTAAPGLSSQDTDAVAAFMKNKIVAMIADDREAEDIVDFVDDVDPSVNDLLAQFSPDLVTSFLAQDSILSRATRLPNWNQFLVTAQSYIKQIRAEDAAIASQAAAVPS